MAEFMIYIILIGIKKKLLLKEFMLELIQKKRMIHNKTILFRNKNNQLVNGRFSEYFLQKNNLAVKFAKREKIPEFTEWYAEKLLRERGL